MLSIKKIKKIVKKILIFLTILLGIFILYILIQKPSLNREWELDQKILSEISFSGSIVDIKNIRNFKYNSVNDYEINYYNKTYNIDKIESVYYIIEPFTEHDGPAHTMLSFGFEDGSFLVISSEIRKEVGESFSAFWGFLNKYEIVYILGDENDLIKLRANHRKDDVFMYPIKIEKETMQKVFVSALQKSDKLSKEPEFYNTLTNTCTTSILEHMNIVRASYGYEKIPWSKLIFLPSHSDEIAYELGLIDTKLPLKEAREYYKINELSEKYKDDENYSIIIRKERK